MCHVLCLLPLQVCQFGSKVPNRTFRGVPAQCPSVLWPLFQSQMSSFGSRWRRLKVGYKRVRVPTDALSLRWVGDESLVTPAAVAPHGVLTAAVPADAWFGCTLVQI